MNELELYEAQLIDVIRAGETTISNIKPSDWAEQNIIMGKPFPGPLRYTKTPYTREIADCLSPDHPCRWLAIMKAAQIGLSSTFITAGIGWIIKNQPGNIMLTVGAPDLIEKAVEKLDLMIDNAGLRDYIKPQVQRKRNNKTGDTNFKKEFAGGYVTIASAQNHKAIRQVDLQYGFFDDFEAIKQESKESGNTRKLLEQRFASYADTHKICYISTPERDETSNIKPAFLLGDQRKFLIPCPCCGEFIELKWSVQRENSTEMGGITWQLDEFDKVISDSVGYICQKCGDFFNDKNKHELLNNGYWKATAQPSKEGYYSYHINALYAPLGMYDWEHYVNDWLEAHPKNQPRDEGLYKTFVNVCLGETYVTPATNIKATQLQRNIREYGIGIIPEQMSVRDGNGKIVLLTCAADLGGRVAGVNSDYDDVRLDWEITAWSESGSEYKIDQGSIGTFVPYESGKKNKEEREFWSYDISKPNNVWREFDKILSAIYTTDTGRQMQIGMTGIDSGFAEHHVFSYIDKTNNKVIGLKGDKEHKYVQFGVTVPNFTQSKARYNLFILKVGQMKDQLTARIVLKWDKNNDDEQPPGFINFPQPGAGKYGLESYFEHYEAEDRLLDKDNNFIWKKKTANAQNHFFDVAVYNTAVKEILTKLILEEVGIKKGTWADFVNLLK